MVKAGILGAALLRAQDAGRGLSASEVALASPMMRLSPNPEASRLLGVVGGASGLDRYESRLDATGETSYTSAFGAARPPPVAASEHVPEAGLPGAA